MAFIHLPPVFSDHMILQRNKPIRISGSCTECKTLRIVLGSDEAAVSVRCGISAAWRACGKMSGHERFHGSGRKHYSGALPFLCAAFRILLPVFPEETYFTHGCAFSGVAAK